MVQRRKILFVASELTPLAKVGGLGDVVGSLPKALVEQGAEVGVIIPRYTMIPISGLQRVGVITVPLAKGAETVTIYKTVIPHSRVTVWCLDNRTYLSRGPIYGSRSAFAGSFSEIQRFLFFSKAVYELLQHGMLAYDIIHCHDWHTGTLAALLRGSNRKTVFTIHNLANQGVWPAKEVDRWFGANSFRAVGREYNFMSEGIRNAGLVTTVSPTYAKEILTKQYGEGLEGLLKKRAARRELTGILNGIDYSFWPIKKNPVKAKHRAPVFALISRLTEQKGLTLLLPLISHYVRECGAVFRFLGQGEARLEKALQSAARKYPRNVKVKIGFDEALAHRWYREADFFLMPSLFEPCGLGQMIAMRYGTPPIVRATGGLRDSVRHLKNGFVFQGESQAGLEKAMEQAIAVFYDKKKLAALRRRCLSADFSWKISARRYRALYSKLFRRSRL